MLLDNGLEDTSSAKHKKAPVRGFFVFGRIVRVNEATGFNKFVAKDVRKILKDNKCYFVRHGKGDHDIWASPLSHINFTVPTNIKSRHTANAILKQAGLRVCRT